MYIKNKRRVFKCIPLYTMYCFQGNFEKLHKHKETNELCLNLSHSIYEYNKWRNYKTHDYV